jgi:hypothetical protein
LNHYLRNQSNVFKTLYDKYHPSIISKLQIHTSRIGNVFQVAQMLKKEQYFNSQLTGEGFQNLQSKCFYDQTGSISFLRYFDNQTVQGQGKKVGNLLEELKATRTVAHTFEFLVLNKKKIYQIF